MDSFFNRFSMTETSEEDNHWKVEYISMWAVSVHPFVSFHLCFPFESLGQFIVCFYFFVSLWWYFVFCLCFPAWCVSSKWHLPNHCAFIIFLIFTVCKWKQNIIIIIKEYTQSAIGFCFSIIPFVICFFSSFFFCIQNILTEIHIFSFSFSISIEG